MNDQVRPLSRRARPSWREHALTRADELEALAHRFELEESQRRAAAEGEADKEPTPDEGTGLQGKVDGNTVTWESLRGHLKALRGEDSPWWIRLQERMTGSGIERTTSRLYAAETDLVRLAPDTYLIGEIESIVQHVERHLAIDDPRRVAAHVILEAKHQGNPDGLITPDKRESLYAAMRGASSEASREIMRVRSFRNVLVAAAVILAGVAIILGYVAKQSPERLAMCFTVVAVGASAEVATDQPEKVVCPTAETDIEPDGDEDVVRAATIDPWDVALIELLGLIAAAVAAAASLRGIRGTSTPYSIPIALAALKLPTGALTAVLGLLLMRGQFIPGLSALDTSAQILGWAIVFGYAQQLFTGVVDTQAGRVLQDVRGGMNRTTVG